MVFMMFMMLCALVMEFLFLFGDYFFFFFSPLQQSRSFVFDMLCGGER